MEKKLIIFEFDGTVANTLEEGVRLYNDLAPRYGFNPITPENRSMLRGKGAREGLKALNISMFRLAFILGKIRSGLKASIARMQAYPGVVEVLETLNQRGYVLVMLSSNSPENIELFLRNNNIAQCFKEIYSGSSVFGKTKHLLKIMKVNGFSSADSYYVGDETRDVEAAHGAHMKAISVTWGLNDTAVLQTMNPEYLLDEPKELLNIFS